MDSARTTPRNSETSQKPTAKFLWGAATSSHQIEGDNVHNDWWAWEKAGNIEGGVSSGKATGHWDKFEEDIKLLADLGMNSYRFSVEWSRIQPAEDRWDRDALERYRQIIEACVAKKIVPMLTLHHFTLPQWIAEKGGFLNPEVVEHFETFTRKVTETLGAKVPLWCTINEPLVLIVGGYLGGFMPPEKSAPELVPRVIENLYECHVRAYRMIHETINRDKDVWPDMPTQVGVAHNMIDFQPDRKYHPIDWVVTRYISRFYNDGWLNLVTGRPAKFAIPGLLKNPAFLSKRKPESSVDFIGLNYYMKTYVCWKPRDAHASELQQIPVGFAFSRRKEPKSDLEWAIHPKGIGKLIRKVSARYRLPIYITENGIADKEDQLRADYIRSHISEIGSAISDGSDVRGYYYWSLLDNFEWVKGFGPRFGLYHVNYETFERKLRRSGKSYQELIQRYGGGAPTGS